MIKTEMKIGHQEAGMAVLSLVLMLVMIGGMMLPVLLDLMITASKAGHMEERKTQEFHAADSGVKAALWRIGTNDKLGGDLNGKWLESIYTYSDNYTLSPADPLNDKTVKYQISPKWVLEGLEASVAPQYRTPADNVTIDGGFLNSTDANGKYGIMLYYDGNSGTLGINRVACWLPPGLDYVGGPSSIEDNTTNPLHPFLVGGHPVIEDFRGGHTVKWNFLKDSKPVDYRLFPPTGENTKEVDFSFTPNETPEGVFCWMSDNSTYEPLAWNNVKMFQVKSTAASTAAQSENNVVDNTTVISISSRNDGQALGSGMEGDYNAFGCTLMRDSDNSDQTSRNRLYRETPCTVTSMQANYQVEAIFLYWTGWKCKPWTSAGNPVAKKVDSVACNITVSGVNYSAIIPSTKNQTMYNNESGGHGWTYSCFADITDRVKGFFKSRNVTYVGNGTYTVGHADFRPGTTAPSTGGPWYRLYKYDSAAAYPYTVENTPVYGWTRYPLGSPLNGGGNNTDNQTSPSVINEGTGSQDAWAYSAWSIVIVYTAPSTLGRRLYRFETFYYGAENSNLTKTIEGFKVPDLTDETNAAKMTCFVGEGDQAYTGDSIVINGNTLATTSTNPSNNVWNSTSYIEGKTITGIDIDTWNIPKSVIGPENTNTATVSLPTGTDSWDLVYMILSMRTKIKGGGSYIYEIQ